MKSSTQLASFHPSRFVQFFCLVCYTQNATIRLFRPRVLPVPIASSSPSTLALCFTADVTQSALGRLTWSTSKHCPASIQFGRIVWDLGWTVTAFWTFVRFSLLTSLLGSHSPFIYSPCMPTGVHHLAHLGPRPAHRVAS